MFKIEKIINFTSVYTRIRVIQNTSAKSYNNDNVLQLLPYIAHGREKNTYRRHKQGDRRGQK